MKPLPSSNHLSRREVLTLVPAAGLGALIPMLLSEPPIPTDAGLGEIRAAANPKADSLGALAARAGIQFGASIGHDLPEDYAQLYRREARILTTDTALKFDFLRPSAKEFNFGPADQILKFADANHMPLRGHTLIWNENASSWLKGLSGAEIERVFDAHLETVVQRYHGRLHSWDVVNEPFWPGHDQPGGYRNGPWFAAMGAAYVPRAFRRVHSIDKSVRLCLNEAHCELANEWGEGIRPRLLGLVDSLLDQGLPLHAVGLQGHIVPEWGSSDEIFQSFLAEVAKRGVDIYITELDMSDKTFPADLKARDAAMAARYASFLTHVLAVPEVRIIETWQLADKYSWYRDLKPDARPLLFDAALKPKPARDALAQALQRRMT